MARRSHHIVLWDNTPKPEMFRQIAAKLGAPITKKRYRMWHNVAHIGRTALVVDCIVEDGGFAIIDMNHGLPREVTRDYTEAAIRAGAFSLGLLDLRFGCVFTGWDELPVDYRPAGYYTHIVGDDVSCA